MALKTIRAYKSFLFMNISDILKTSVSYNTNSSQIASDYIVKLLDFPRTDNSTSKTLFNDKLSVQCGKRIPKRNLKYINYTYDDSKYTITSKTLTLNYTSILIALSTYFGPPDQDKFRRLLDIKIVSSTETSVTFILYLLNKK